MKAFLDILKPNELIYPNTVAIDWTQGKVDRPYGHPYYHWLQTNEGVGIIEINNTKFFLNKNDGILISPFTPHKYYGQHYWTTNYITICGYSSTFFSKLLGDEPFYLIRDAKKISNQLLNIISAVSDDNDTEISLKTYETFLEIRNNILETSNKKSGVLPVYWEVKKYIDSHYMEKLSVNFLSEKFNISPQYLIKIFKQTLGVSPYQYLINKRINESKKILVVNKDLLISEIASLVGIDSSSHFIELFKKQVHCKPSEFRKIFYQGRENYE